MNEITSTAFLFLLFSNVYAGPIGSVMCLSGCGAVAGACYAAAGYKIPVRNVCRWRKPFAVLACVTAHGTCLAACAAAVVTPTP